jgi:oxygen-independent coproporphyrinogen-3 oxidase
MPHQVGVYVHVPFCTAKCHYCDFNSYAGLDRLFGTYVEAVCREIANQPGGLTARTVFFGGGTPSLIAPADLARILGAIRDRFALPPDAEVTIEANPGTVAEARLNEIRALGVNRISFGVQSFDPSLLAELGRIHTADQAARVRRAARAAGFDSVNLDFIYGLPHQSLATWRETLGRALELRPEHLSLYALTVEPGTLFFRRAERGRLPLPDEDLVADMYELADELLAAAGYGQYEISNWALAPEHRCQHNIGYWRNLEYLGVGPGAHSWYGGERYVDTPSPVQWAAQVERGESPICQREPIPPELALGETVMLGLRLVEGLDLDELSARFGVDARARYAEPLRETRELGLVELCGPRVRLAKRARLLGNEVFRRFLLS